MEFFSKPKTLILTVGSHPLKQSLLTRFSNQSDFAYINTEDKQNIFEHSLHHQENIKNRNIIISNIPANVDNFYEAQKSFKDHSAFVIYFKNTSEDNSDISRIVNTYKKLGLLREISLDVTKSIEENYRLFKKSLLSNLIFVGGAPKSGKTVFAKRIASTLGYRYLELNELISNFQSTFNTSLNQVAIVNKLISSLYCSRQNFVIDGLFKTVQSLSVLTEYSNPQKIYYIRTPNDEIQSQIQTIKDQVFKKQKKKQFEEYLANTDTVVAFLKSKSYFVKLDSSQAKNNEQINKLKPTLLYVSDFDHQFIQDLAKEWQGTHLNIKQLSEINSKRNKKTISDTSNIQEKIAYIKNIIANLNGKIILSGLSDKLEDLVQFQKRVAEIKFYFKQSANEDNTKYQQKLTPEMYYLRQQKLITLDSNSSSALVLSYLDTRNPYILISGPEASGKSQISKIIARDYGYKHIDYKTYIEQFKQKNPNQSGQQHTPSQIINHFKQLINQNKQNKYIIEGLPFEKQDYVLWIQQVGSPTLINLRVDNDKWLQRSRLALGNTDLEAQITEQQQQKVASVQAQNVACMNSLNQILESYPSIKLFQLDCNSPLISLEGFVSLIMRPRIFLVAENKNQSDLLYLNIAVKCNFGFFDLAKTDLKTVHEQVSSYPHQRDIILYNYSSKDQLIGEKIHFIESNIGVIRFVGVWEQEQKQFKDQIIRMQRPVVEKKKRVLEQGEEKPEGEEEQAPAEDQANQQQVDENGEPIKPKLDIFNFQWSQIGNAKNLSQWFLRSKGSVKELIFQQSNPKILYDDFDLILRELNRDRNANVYMIVL